MNVVIWDKNKKELEKTRAEIASHIQKGNFFIQQVVDITDSSNVHSVAVSLILQIKEAYEQLHKKLDDDGMQKVSIILNNAGSGVSDV